MGFAVQASAFFGIRSDLATVTGTSMGTYPSKLVGGIPTPLKKYEWEGLSHILWKIKNV